MRATDPSEKAAKEDALWSHQFSHWAFQDSGAMRVIKQFTAGALAGASAKTIIAPLDRVKILFQVSQEPFSFQAAKARAHTIVAEEGFSALYKGNLAMVLRVLPYSGTQLMAFDQFGRLFKARRGAPMDDRLTSMESFLSGAAAGATSVAVTYPLDLMRARLAVQRVFHKYDSLWHAFRTAYADEGFIALYRGVLPTLAGILPYAGLSFLTFETSKQLVQDWSGQDVTTLQRLACGALAGLVGQSVTYPLDVIRRRLQTESFILEHLGTEGWTASRSTPSRAAHIPETVVATHPLVEHSGNTMREVWNRVVAREGYRGLFKGMGMNWIKGPIAVGISFTAFDKLKKVFGVRPDE